MMRVYYTTQYPEHGDMSAPAIFLAGPVPRTPEVASWRPRALELLRAVDWQADVYYPEFDPLLPPEAAARQVELQWPAMLQWETQMLTSSRVILFWVPRDMATLPGLTTNIEFGMWCGAPYGPRVVLGYPAAAQHVRVLKWHADRVGIAVRHTLEETVSQAVIAVNQTRRRH